MSHALPNHQILPVSRADVLQARRYDSPKPLSLAPPTRFPSEPRTPHSESAKLFCSRYPAPPTLPSDGRLPAPFFDREQSPRNTARFPREDRYGMRSSHPSRSGHKSGPNHDKRPKPPIHPPSRSTH